MSTANALLLRYLYADLARVAEIAAPYIVLHPADGGAPVLGLDAVTAREEALIAATGGTLVMDVYEVSATEYFGTVLGTLRAERPEPVAMPFCGLWRFREGEAVEHWENAYDPAALGRALFGARA